MPIVGRLGLADGPPVFVSDTEAELDAAAQAGVRTALCARSATPHTSAHAVVRTFFELDLSRPTAPRA